MRFIAPLCGDGGVTLHPGPVHEARGEAHLRERERARERERERAREREGERAREREGERDRE